MHQLTMEASSATEGSSKDMEVVPVKVNRNAAEKQGATDLDTHSDLILESSTAIAEDPAQTLHGRSLGMDARPIEDGQLEGVSNENLDTNQEGTGGASLERNPGLSRVVEEKRDTSGGFVLEMENKETIGAQILDGLKLDTDANTGADPNCIMESNFPINFHATNDAQTFADLGTKEDPNNVPNSVVEMDMVINQEPNNIVDSMVELSGRDNRLDVGNEAGSGVKILNKMDTCDTVTISEQEAYAREDNTQCQGRSALWVKWRGKWQAGIQCSLDDCPVATVKGMPTYGRKTYIVVYFPCTRSYAWTDWQLVCPINESPEPLASGSLKSGRESVSDLNAARRYMLRKITTAMLDISDRLPIQTVVEAARRVSFWKEFAKDAAQVMKYSELGVMLVKLQEMILPTYLKEFWMDTRFEDWRKQCGVTETAWSLEKLVKELRNAVCWDEVGKIWDASEQANLDSEWKNWKEDVQQSCSNETSSYYNLTLSLPSLHTGSLMLGSHTHHGYGWGDKCIRSFDANDMMSDPGRKRLKFEVDDRSAHDSYAVQIMQSKLDCSSGKCFNQEQGHVGSESKMVKLSPSKSVPPVISKMNHAVGVTDVQYGANLMNRNGLASSSAVYSAENNPSMRNLLALHHGHRTPNGSLRCSAFSIKKGRQCNKYASDGSVYCWKHTPSTSAHSRKKNESVPSKSGLDEVNPVICNGMTKYGRRCTHKARDGSSFCLKHLLQDAVDRKKETGGINSPLEKTSTSANIFNRQSYPSPQRIPTLDQGASNRKRKHDSSLAGHHGWFDSRVQDPSGQGKSPSKTVPRAANWTRCIGWCRGSGGQCSHRAKPGYSHCEKHLPGSLGYGGKGQEKYLSKEVIAGLARNSTQEEEKVLSRARDLLHEFMKACLAEGGGRDGQQLKSQQKIMDWLLLEVTGDLKAAETLFSLVKAETDSLSKFLEKEDAEHVNSAIVPYVPVPVTTAAPSVPMVVEKTMGQPLPSVGPSRPVSLFSNGHIQRFKCKLCPQEFIELVVLSQHWRACHKREAQQLFRGYVCQHCSLPFTNKKGLARHRNAHHMGRFKSNSSLISLCIVCSVQFKDFEGLWQHVLYSHPEQLYVYVPPGHTNNPLNMGKEVAKIFRCPHCEQTFVGYSHLRQHEEICYRKVMHPAGISNIEDVGRVVPSDNVEKYKCKLCGLRFRLLPDLGRHHQAVHKTVQAMKLKTGKDEESAMGLLAELSSSITAGREQKRLQKLDVRRASSGSQSKVETQIGEQHYQMGIRELHDPVVAEIEGHHGPKVQKCPTNKDILAVARFACCKNRLLNILGRKYATLPEKLSIKAAKLCSEANVRLQWHREGFICPNGCKEYGHSADSRFSFPNSLPGASFTPLQVTAQSSEVVGTYKQENQSGEIISDENHLVLTAPFHSAEKYGGCIVLCDDLSLGREKVSIPCVVDRDVIEPCNCSLCLDKRGSHTDSLRPWANFSYVTKRLLDPSLGLDTKSSQLGCMCREPHCLPENCDHVYLFDNDNTDARDIYGKLMRGRFPYDSNGQIVLEEGYLVYECNSICNCQEDCQNRVLQKGVRVKLEVYKTKHKGWAVRAGQPIARGTFVCEYIGEVLNDQEANKRGERYDKEGCSYLYDIDAHIDSDYIGRTKPFVIDATKYGNVARFINHSCSPNLVNYQVLVESMDCQLAHIGLYASRDIKVGEELAYDYRYKLLPGKGCPCHCGAKSCRGRLY